MVVPGRNMGRKRRRVVKTASRRPSALNKFSRRIRSTEKDVSKYFSALWRASNLMISTQLFLPRISCARVFCVKAFVNIIKFDSIGDYVEPPSYVYHKTQQPETITGRYIRRWRTLSDAHASLGARRKESFSKAVSELHSGGESCVRVVQSFWFLLWLEFRAGEGKSPATCTAADLFPCKYFLVQLQAQRRHADGCRITVVG